MGETKTSTENTSPETSAKKKTEKKAPKKRSFFKNLKAEFAKIIWPSKSDVTKETAAIVFVSAVMGVLIYIADALFKAGILFISQ